MTKVLVVDDEKLIVKGIRFSLEQDNMEVDCAYDGEEAMSKACLLYTSPSPRDLSTSRMPSSA